jgi:hypothetical protein
MVLYTVLLCGAVMQHDRRLIESPKWCGTLNNRVATAVWFCFCAAWHKTQCKFRSATKYLTLVTDGWLRPPCPALCSVRHVKDAWGAQLCSLVCVKFSGCAMCTECVRSVSPPGKCMRYVRENCSGRPTGTTACLWPGEHKYQSFIVLESQVGLGLPPLFRAS